MREKRKWLLCRWLAVLLVAAMAMSVCVPAFAARAEDVPETTEAEQSEETVPETTEAEPPEETIPETTEAEPPEETVPETTEAEPPEETVPETTEAEPPEETVPETTEAEPPEETVPEIIEYEQQELRQVCAGQIYIVSGNLPKGISMVVTPIDPASFDFLAGEILGSDALDVYAAVDITLYLNGVEYEPEEAVTVTIQGVAPDVEIYHLPGTAAQEVYAAENVPCEELDAMPVDGGVSFTTDGFSVIIAARAKEEGNTYDDIDPDGNFITVQKTFSGITAEQVQSLGEQFQINVTGTTGYGLKLTDPGVQISGDGLTYRWTIQNAGVGTYRVSETGETLPDYEVTTTGTGSSVSVIPADFTVTFDKKTTCSHKNWPVKIDGDYNILFAAALTTGGCVVISKEPLTAAQKETVAKAITGTTGNWKAPVAFYSISANGYGPYTIQGKELRYDPDTQEVILSKTKDWTHVATVQYSVTAASNPDIRITNDYTKKIADIIVNKRVTGSMGDLTKAFTFTYKIGAWGTEETFTLSHGTDITLRDLPIGKDLYIKEEAGVYTATVSATDGEGETVSLSPDEDGWYQIPVQTGGSVTFVNDYNCPVDTGISLDMAPFAVILGAAAGGAGLLVRKKQEL